MVVLSAPGARAQAAPQASPPAPAPASASADGLKGGGFYLEADELIENDTDHTVIAKGSVEARYEGRVLRAEELDYNRDTGIVVAKGDVRILEPDGTSQFASYITLDKDMSEGVAIGFSSRLSGGVKIAASSVVRRANEITDLNRAIYTPCPVCADNAGKPPSWSIRARKVVENKKKHSLIFHDAVLEVKNFPILYLPIFEAADPSAPRRSGFLLPTPTVSGQRGLSLDVPYYQVLSPSADITISPQFSTKVNPFLNIDLRKRFWSGTVDVRAGYTYDQDFTSGGTKFGPLTSRSYILADGDFTLSPTWSWGFTAEQASDKLIFDKYSIGDVFVDRGLYAADDRRLISQLYAIRQDSTSYFSIAALSIEGLRATDEQSEFPIVAPIIEFHDDPQTAILGGRLRIDASGVALTQDRAFGDPTLPGVDERRASADVDWRRTFTLADGLRLSPFLWGRADLYNIENYPAVDSSAVVPRAFGTIGLDADWPFYKVTKSATWILEPMAQLAISPNPSIDTRIPDEDSVDFEFDETNLFEPDKSPGYDIFDGGQKFDLGGRASVLFQSGASASVLVGKSLRLEPAPNIPAYAGLRSASSDWLFDVSASPRRGIDFFSDWRLNSATFSPDRIWSGLDFRAGPIAGYVSYLQERVSPSGAPVKSLDLHAEAFVSKHWGIDSYVIRDFAAQAWRKEDVGIVYRDNCVRIELLYRRDETVNGTFGPTNAVVLRLSLATMGNSGYRRASEPPLY